MVDDQPWPDVPLQEDPHPPVPMLAADATSSVTTTPTSPSVAQLSQHGWKFAAAAFGLATVVFGALWVQTKDEVHDLRAEQAAQEARDKAAREAIPDLRALADAVKPSASSVVYEGDADALDVTIRYPDSDSNQWLETYLDDLGFPAATMDRIGNTRALDGTLSADGDHASMTWTYHPDDGLSIVFGVER